MDAIKMMVDHNISSVAIYEGTDFIGLITGTRLSEETPATRLIHVGNAGF